MPDVLDPRINPYRSDIAAKQLQGRVNAADFVDGFPWRVVQGALSMHKEPNVLAERVSQLRHGDNFTVYEQKDGWCWGQAERDGYVGYVQEDGLRKRDITIRQNLYTLSFRVAPLTSLVFAEPNIKAPIMDQVHYFSLVEGVFEIDGFMKIAGGGYLHRRHLVPVKEWAATDYVATAQRMTDVPYLWGGCTPAGLDCSGLVQLVLEAAGKVVPRDSDMQAKELGLFIADTIQGVPLQRGDLIFMKGHVGLMADAKNLLHANAYHGRVVTEPLADVARRYDGAFQVRRLAS